MLFCSFELYDPLKLYLLKKEEKPWKLKGRKNGSKKDAKKEGTKKWDNASPQLASWKVNGSNDVRAFMRNARWWCRTSCSTVLWVHSHTLKEPVVPKLSQLILSASDPVQAPEPLSLCEEHSSQTALSASFTHMSCCDFHNSEGPWRTTAILLLF